jgi:predicted RNA-binding protein with PUA-like domain
VRYWLLKSEPDVFGIDDLAAAPRKTTYWDGVRNYQARNFMRDQMQIGDGVFFYHSNCKVPGIVGIARVACEAYPDPTQFDPESDYFDPKSSPDAPRWYMVDVKLERKLKRPITLAEMKQYADAELAGFALLRRGNRLSVLPVSDEHWRFILSLE